MATEGFAELFLTKMVTYGFVELFLAVGLFLTRGLSYRKPQPKTPNPKRKAGMWKLSDSVMLLQGFDAPGGWAQP